MSETICVRLYKPSDKNFILASWLRGLYYGESPFSRVPKNVFMDKYHAHLEMLLSFANTEVMVACLESDPDVIIGYSVLAVFPRALHWVHVKKDFRNIGIAKKLVPADVTVATQYNKVGLAILETKKWAYNPFIL